MNLSFWFELLIRSAALLSACEVLRHLSRRRGAAFQHRLLLSAFALLAMLPVFSVLCPEIRIPVSKKARVETAVITVSEVSGRAVDAPHKNAGNWPMMLWLLGVAVASTPMFAGSIAVWRMARGSVPLAHPALPEALERFAPALTSRAEVRVCRMVCIPLTCGVIRSKILLPAEAEGWSRPRLETVLAHELAHVRRHDVAFQMAAHVVAALWWFQPLVWIGWRQLRRESEFACDAEVLRAGIRSSEYAKELLALAKTAGRNAGIFNAAISMARSSDLEKRVRAILRPPAALAGRAGLYGVGTVLGTVALAAATLSVGSSQSLSERGGSTMKRTIMAALLTSAGLTAATISGTVSDSSGAPLSDVRVLLTNPDTGAKQEAKTAADGAFAFDGNSAGQYILKLEKSGYTSMFREFDVKADSKVDRDFTMPNEGGEPVPDKVAGANGQQPQSVRVGGRVAQANLITKVPPIYPVAAKAEHLQGTVEIEGTISKDGVPTELRVLRSPGDELAESALEAVRQWRYRPTLLNGEPVGIVTDIIVNYTLTQ